MRNVFTALLVFIFVFVLMKEGLFAAPEPTASSSSHSSSQVVEKPGQFSIKLRTLEERINSLKDKIFRAKQKLSILHETVLSGTIAGARATITHRSDVGRSFTLISMIYYLDDAPAFKRINAPKELKKDEIVVFDGSLVPGPHHISVYLVYKGKGFGLFSYMKGYDLKVQSGHSFNIEEGVISDILITVKDKGAVAKLEKRLYLQFDTHKKDFIEDTKDDALGGVNTKNE
ncbi:hypothetical protein KAH37_02445 [bacterium]|nr:hypothetical protein [bacterium]